MKPKSTILISSFNRLSLLRRTLWSIATFAPQTDFEVILVDDGSTDDILSELKLYSSRFHWKFIRFNHADFERETGIAKFFNNSSTTMNIGFRHAQGNLIFQQGNEVLASEGLYDKLIEDSPKDGRPFFTMSTTLDIPEHYLELLDQYGSNLTPAMVSDLYRWPLQSKFYQSLVTNYVSLAPMNMIQTLKGFDERYMCGIGCEDSDIVRRARKLPDFQLTISEALSFHQWHGGKTTYRPPIPSVITQKRFDEGCSINRAHYNGWDETYENTQSWEWGKFGEGEIISNG